MAVSSRTYRTNGVSRTATVIGLQFQSLQPSLLVAARDATPSSSPIQLDHLAMVTGQEGWGLASGSVVVTRDGGGVWQRVTPPGFPTTSAQFCNLGSIAAASPTA